MQAPRGQINLHSCSLFYWAVGLNSTAVDFTSWSAWSAWSPLREVGLRSKRELLLIIPSYFCLRHRMKWDTQRHCTVWVLFIFTTKPRHYRIRRPGVANAHSDLIECAAHPTRSAPLFQPTGYVWRTWLWKDCSTMHRYHLAEKIGDGTYGEVLRATNKTSGETVAIKRWGLICASALTCCANGQLGMKWWAQCINEVKRHVLTKCTSARWQNEAQVLLVGRVYESARSSVSTEASPSQHRWFYYRVSSLNADGSVLTNDLWTLPKKARDCVGSSDPAHVLPSTCAAQRNDTCMIWEYSCVTHTCLHCETSLWRLFSFLCHALVSQSNSKKWFAKTTHCIWFSKTLTAICTNSWRIAKGSFQSRNYGI